MTYYYESEGEITPKRKHANPERDQEKLFWRKVRKENGIYHHLNEGFSKMPYDGVFGFKGKFIPLEFKVTYNKQRYSMEGWRNRQNHQFKALFDAYQNGFWVAKIICWKPEGYWYWLVMDMSDMLKATIELPNARVFTEPGELYDILGERYNGN